MLDVTVRGYQMMQSQRPEWPLSRLVFVILICTGYAYVALALLYMAHLWPF